MSRQPGLLGNFLKTYIIDPRYHSDSRSIFKLDSDKMYMSNMRLSISATSADGTRFLRLGGIYNIIDRVFLYNGRELLDVCRDVNIYLSAEEFNKPNKRQHGTEYRLSGNYMPIRVPYPSVKMQDASFSDPNYIITVNSDSVPPQNTTLSTTTAKYYLQLDRILRLLKVGYLPTELFPDLQLVIEWKKTSVLEGSANITSVIEPQLIIDELLNEDRYADIMRLFERGIEYEAIESDRINISALVAPANDTSTAQSTKARIDGFNKKVVSKMLLVTEPSTSVHTNTGKMVSQAQYKEEIKFTVNGTSLYPYQQIDSSALKLGLHKDIFGQSTCYWGANEWKTALELIDNRSKLYSIEAQYLLNALSYGGVRINDFISNLQVEYNRTANHGDAFTYQALTLYLFGYVKKMVRSEGQQAIIKYSTPF